MTIKKYSYQDRPSEKLLSKGAESLSDSEILAIILNTGTKEKSALDISKEIVSKDEENIGFSFLSQYSVEELMKIEGIGQKKATLIKAVCEFAKRFKLDVPNPKERITTPEKLSKVFMLDLYDETQEIVKTAIFDTKNRVIKVVTNSKGAVNSNTIAIKDILSVPIKAMAPKIAICHNHPSGDVTPSQEDIIFTKKLLEACNLFNITLLDHIIIRQKFFL